MKVIAEKQNPNYRFRHLRGLPGDTHNREGAIKVKNHTGTIEVEVPPFVFLSSVTFFPDEAADTLIQIGTTAGGAEIDASQTGPVTSFTYSLQYVTPAKTSIFVTTDKTGTILILTH